MSSLAHSHLLNISVSLKRKARDLQLSTTKM